MFSFTSLSFVFIFLPISILGFFLISLSRNIKVVKTYLLILSLLFWCWLQFETFALLIFLILQLFFIGNVIYVNRLQEDIQHKISNTGIFVGIFVLCFVLFYFKLHTVLSKFSFGKSLYGEKNIIIPIGLSFIIFSCISYIVDIYRGDAQPGTLLDTALYITFFPKLLSGPIVLWKDFHITERRDHIAIETIWSGIERICIGYAKKVIIADYLGGKILEIHSVMQTSTVSIIPPVDRPTYWICALLYMFQIYYDFSGYSDIAIGLGRIFGVKIQENFDFPYTSKSISEFWRRWHISLGTWFKEYIYIPLGGSRKGCVYVNLFIVFLLTGIWHGIGWTFLLWGILNGFFVCIERYIINRGWNSYIPAWIKHIYLVVFLYFSWILFSSSDIHMFIEYGKNMLKYRGSGLINFTWAYYLSFRTIILLVIAVIGCFVPKIPFINNFYISLEKCNSFIILRVIGCLLLMCISILFIVNSSYSPFIYFQF